MNFSALRASTLPGLLVDQTQTRPDRVAYRAKELGVWRETTWRQYAERVAAVAVGFAREYRVARGETVAIIGNPCPEWAIADLAAQALGAITYGIYPTSAPGEVRHLLQHGGASLVVAEDQEHLDKTLEVLDDCPGVRAVLVADTRALFMYRHPRVRPLVEVEDRGREALAGEPDVLARLVPRLSADAPATIIYTSGTTGHPKGAVYRHGPHLAACANIVAHYPILARRTDVDPVRLDPLLVLGSGITGQPKHEVVRHDRNRAGINDLDQRSRCAADRPRVARDQRADGSGIERAPDDLAVVQAVVQ